MAVSAPTHLQYATSQSGSGVTSLAFASSSPASDCLLIVAGTADSASNSADAISSITTTLSNVGTWTVIEKYTANIGGQQNSFIAYAKVTGAPGSGTVTVNWSGLPQDAIVMELLYVTGHDTTTPLVRHQEFSGSGTSASGTLSVAPSSTSEVFVLYAVANPTNIGSSNITPGSGFTEVGEQYIGNTTWNFGLEIETQYRLSSTGTTVAASGPNDGWAIMAIEIAQGSTGTTANAGLASVTVTANTAGQSKATTIGAGSATATAYQPTVVRAITGAPGVASATATAYNPTVSTGGGPVTANAGLASVTVTANNPTVARAITASAGLASATAAAYQATVTNPYVWQEDFVLPDGSAWPTSRWTKTGSMTTDIQSNFGRIVTGTTSNASTLMKSSDFLNGDTDIDFTVRVKFTNITNGGFFYFIQFRGATGVGGTPYALFSSYEFRLLWYNPNSSIGVNFYEVDGSGSKTFRNGADHLASTIAAGDWVWFRFQVTGSPVTTLRYRIWKDGTTEPGSWTNDWTSSVVANNTGIRFALAVQNGDTTSEDLGFDDLSIIAASPNTSASAGLASVTVTANGTGQSKATTIGAASATATAYQPTVVLGKIASAGLASATATAYQPGTSHATTAGNASATATAYNPTGVTATSGYFTDTFPGSSIDSTKWDVYDRLGDQVNNEVNAVIPANVRVSGGSLFIDQKFEDVSAGDTTTGPPNPRTVHYTSGQVAQHSAPILYGDIRVRAKIPGGVGNWPCIWMLGFEWQASQPYTANVAGHNWPNDGWWEIDIAEFMYDHRTVVNNALHFITPSRTGSGEKSLPFDATSRFMVYRLVWTATSLTWYVDAEDGNGWVQTLQITGTAGTDIPNTAGYLIIHCAIGGNVANTPDSSTFPTVMEVTDVSVLAPGTAEPSTGSVAATAYNPTVVRAITASAGLASVTVTANNAGQSKATTIGAASATSTAYDPTGLTATGNYEYYPFTQADGAASGWTAASAIGAATTSNLLVVSNQVQSSGQHTVGQGSGGYRTTTLNLKGNTDWRVDIQVDTALYSTYGGVTVWFVNAATGNGYGFFVGNAMHAQRITAGASSNITNDGLPGSNVNTTDHAANWVTLIHKANGDMETLLNGSHLGAITDTTHAAVTFDTMLVLNYSNISGFDSTFDNLLISEGLTPAITYPPSVSSTANAGSGSATATAYNPSVAITVPGGNAAATATAFQPTVVRAIAATAGLASATATGYQPGTSHATTAGAAAATATGYDPSTTITGSSTANAGNAAVTATANNPAVAIASSAGNAPATAAAYNPTVVRAINPTAGNATVTASAYNPTVVTAGGSVTATPGTAQVTVTAFNRVTRTAVFEITAVTQTVTLTEREARRQGLRGSRLRVGSNRVPPSIMKHGSTYTVVRAPTPEQIAAADIFYQGGHIYEVTETEASALTAAGYGSMLTYYG